jgi:hypothetical protein
MAKRKKRRADVVDAKLNEPTVRIPGGSSRTSVRVSRKALPGVAMRQKLNRLLLVHDPEDAEKALEAIGEDHLPVIRRIAMEGAITGIEPVLRQHAIAVLGRFPTSENVNLLSDLARNGEDGYVRGYAMTALAGSGLDLVAPILAQGLQSRERIESRRAELGLVSLGKRIGVDRLRNALGGQRSRKVLATLEEIYAAIEGPERKRTSRRRRTGVDKG